MFHVHAGYFQPVVIAPLGQEASELIAIFASLLGKR